MEKEECFGKKIRKGNRKFAEIDYLISYKLSLDIVSMYDFLMKRFSTDFAIFQCVSCNLVNKKISIWLKVKLGHRGSFQSTEKIVIKFIAPDVQCFQNGILRCS